MTEFIITSSLMILLITAVRYIFKGKISLRLQYGLWLIVAIRLLIPFQISSSAISVLNMLPENKESTYSEDVIVPENIQLQDIPEYVEVSYTYMYDDHTVKVTDRGAIIKTIWLTGAAAFMTCVIISNVSFSLRLRKDRKQIRSDEKLSIFTTNEVSSACLYGIVKPSVYMPERYEGKEAEYIITHELTHYSHGDHIWSVVRMLCLCLHWYNPLVWLAAVLSKRDCELACDESTLIKLGESERIDYGKLLVKATVGSITAKELLCCTTTMTMGKKGLRERVSLIAKKPRMLAVTLIMVIIIVAAAVSCTFTGADETDKNNDTAISDTKAMYEKEKAIRDAILSHDEPRHAVGEFFTEAHKILHESSTEDSITIYLQVRYQTYNYVDGVMKKNGGSSYPAAITFDIYSNEVTEYWEPMDGEKYYESIKEKFPSKLIALVDNDDIVDELKKECDRDAEEYLKTRPSEEELLNKVVENGGRKDDPLSSQLDPYDMLLSREDATLRYIYRECYKGGQTDEKSKYMMSLLSRILDSEAIKLETSTLQEYFDALVEHAERVLEQNGAEELEKNYPKIYLLLKLGGKTE